MDTTTDGNETGDVIKFKASVLFQEGKQRRYDEIIGQHYYLIDRSHGYTKPLTWKTIATQHSEEAEYLGYYGSDLGDYGTGGEPRDKGSNDILTSFKDVSSTFEIERPKSIVSAELDEHDSEKW